MIINEVIAQLRVERDRLNAAIDALERLLTPAAGKAEPTRRRGRREMDPKAREEVSARMKRYWSDKRNAGKAETQVMYSAMAS